MTTCPLGRSSDWHCYAFFSRVHMTIFIIHENMRQKQNTRFHVPTHLGETRPKTPETDQWLAANQPPLHWHSLGNPRLEEKTASNLWRNINPQKKKNILKKVEVTKVTDLSTPNFYHLDGGDHCQYSSRTRVAAHWARGWSIDLMEIWGIRFGISLN